MKADQLLIQAKALISDPNKWTTGAFARTDRDLGVSEVNTRACKWCALGAVYKVAKDANVYPVNHKDVNSFLKAEKALNKFASERGLGWDVTAFNDNATHSQVMEMFDTAIEELP